MATAHYSTGFVLGIRFLEIIFFFPHPPFLTVLYFPIPTRPKGFNFLKFYNPSPRREKVITLCLAPMGRMGSSIPLPSRWWGKKVPEAQLMRVGGWEEKLTLEAGVG
jgi:hypothetical protein